MEGGDLVADGVDRDAAPVEPLAERFVVAPEVAFSLPALSFSTTSAGMMVSLISSSRAEPTTA